MTKEDAESLNKEAALGNGFKTIFPIEGVIDINIGLTKREYIATQLMAASMSYGQNQELAASMGVKGADLLLIELRKNLSYEDKN
jgi:hypothetical protein